MDRLPSSITLASRKTILLVTAILITFTLIFTFSASIRESSIQILEEQQLLGDNTKVDCIGDTATIHQKPVEKLTWEQCLTAESERETYLSIVIVSRMDDYAG